MTRILAAVLIGLIPTLAYSQARKDRYGDPLPKGAILRLGTKRFASDARCLAFSQDGKRLLAWYTHFQPTRLFDPMTGKTLREFPESRSAALAPDGNCVTLIQYDDVKERHKIVDFDATTGRQTGHFFAEFGKMAFSPDGKTLVTLPWWKAPCAWNAASGKSIWKSTEELLGPERHNDFLRHVAFSTDGKRVIGSDWRDFSIWNAADGKRVFRRSVVAKEKYWASPDGKLLGEVTQTGVAVRSVPSLKLVREWPAGNGRPFGRGYVWGRFVTAIAFSPDNALVAWAARNYSITVAELKTGKTWCVFAPTGRFTYTLLFSPDGKKIASADGDGMIRLWDVLTGKSLNAEESHHGAIQSLTVSGDGKKIVTASDDHTIRVWDAFTGKQQRVLIAKAERLALSKDANLH